MKPAVGVTQEEIEAAVMKALGGYHTDFHLERSALDGHPDRVRLGTGKVHSLAARVWTILKHGDLP